jgi:hypothetical protein
MQPIIFKLRAPRDDVTTNINFNFNKLPKDKYSESPAAIDIDQGKVNIPITVSRKEITVTRLDSLIKNKNFTRGLDGNVLFAFEISNRGYKDPLFVDSLQLTFTGQYDTTRLTDLALGNMLDWIKVINYEQSKIDLIKPQLIDPKVYAEYVLAEDGTSNPINVGFDSEAELPPDSSEIMLVIVKFTANAVTRSFKTVLSGINAYDEDPEFPVAIVDEEGRILGENNYFTSSAYNVISNDPEEAFANYPNPFGQPPYESTKIRFYLQQPSDVTLRIYTLLGELVRSKWDRNLIGLDSGSYDGYVQWDGRNDRGVRVLNGVYLCTIEIKSNNSTERYITKIAYIK